MNNENYIQVSRLRTIKSEYRPIENNGLVFESKLIDEFYDQNNEKIGENSWPTQTVTLRSGRQYEELQTVIRDKQWEPNTTITRTILNRVYIRT